MIIDRFRFGISCGIFILKTERAAPFETAHHCGFPHLGRRRMRVRLQDRGFPLCCRLICFISKGLEMGSIRGIADAFGEPGIAGGLVA
jgi:hypothetical protein